MSRMLCFRLGSKRVRAAELSAQDFALIRLASLSAGDGAVISSPAIYTDAATRLHITSYGPRLDVWSDSGDVFASKRTPQSTLLS